jgi:CheY-like chemotaxis protein
MNVRCILDIFKPKLENNKHMTVLVIDDSVVDQKVASAAVMRGGYQLVQAFDGKTGISLAKTHKPDLIIMDYNLPDSKGPELCQALKDDQETSKIPVLFLTSMETPDSIINCYEKGGENYLAKPISPKLLLKQIAQAIRDSQEEN